MKEKRIKVLVAYIRKVGECRDMYGDPLKRRTRLAGLSKLAEKQDDIKEEA